MSEKILVVTDETFDEQVVQNSLPVLVDFWADWCGPCRMIAPILEQLAEKYDGKVVFAKLNVDENKNAASRHNIRAIPALLLFKDGQVMDKVTGVQTKEFLQGKVDSLL